MIPSEELARKSPTPTNDLVALSELASAYLETMAHRLQRQPRLQGVRDEALIYEAATDAILNYAENPSSFDPVKSKLPT